MIGRINFLEGDPGKIDEAIAFVRERVQPHVEAQAGSHGLGMWVNRETGDSIVTTAWADQAACDASEEHVKSVRAEAAAVAGAKSVRVEIAEPVVVWQSAADQPGYWCRVVEMDVPVDRIGESVALFRDEILSQVQQIPGVNTIVYFVNRDTGRATLNVTYRSKAELDAGRERGIALRKIVVERLNAQEPIVHELETAIVGIRGEAAIDLTSTESRAEIS